ncbi:MAG TPA: TRAP transporter small permease subunit [Burkholderiales bacterium]|nr:TRAP transporter small permease subunit [Burkholderiales bacterium]
MLARVLDVLLGKVVTWICVVMLAAMVAFTLYTVFMRAVLNDPPFWGDTLTLIANIWLVMFSFALSIRTRESIAMQMIYDYVPARVAGMLETLWNLLFVALGLMMVIHGYQVAERIPGTYWELGNAPKSWLMMILPISGVLVILAALRVLAEDIRALRRGERLGRREGVGQV